MRRLLQRGQIGEAGFTRKWLPATMWVRGIFYAIKTKTEWVLVWHGMVIHDLIGLPFWPKQIQSKQDVCKSSKMALIIDMPTPAPTQGSHMGRILQTVPLSR